MHVYAWVAYGSFTKSRFSGGAQPRIAPSALRVGATEAANTACLVAASTREHLLQEGHTDNDDVVSLHASDDN